MRKRQRTDGPTPMFTIRRQQLADVPNRLTIDTNTVRVDSKGITA